MTQKREALTPAFVQAGDRRPRCGAERAGTWPCIRLTDECQGEHYDKNGRTWSDQDAIRPAERCATKPPTGKSLCVLKHTANTRPGDEVPHLDRHGASWATTVPGSPKSPTRRVQHDEVKPGMVIKLANHGSRGRWVVIDYIYGYRLSTPQQAAATDVRAYYKSDQSRKRFQVLLYAHPDGFQLHPESEVLAAKEVMRAGRADFVQNLVLREYSIKLHVVDHVDNEGTTCGYCEERPINCNIYATVTTDSGRTEESSWSTCDWCIISSVDEVEDVDSAYPVTIERAQRR